MSTGTTGAIKGGMAYVQAYLDDNPLTQGLAKLQTKLKSWQAGLSKLAAGTMGGELPEPFAAIARFAASPAGAFTALTAAAKITADSREEMYRMSEATGVAVEKLSTLAYAARRAGVSNEALANSLKRMQGKEFLSAMQGMGGKGGGLKALTAGVFAKMGSGDAVDRLREFIRLSEQMPSEEKIGLARRMGLSELLPLINQGIVQLDAFTQRAKDLGLVVREEDAKAGKLFGLAWGDLHDVLMSSVSAIGGALVPAITGLTNITVRVVTTVRDWLKNHQALTQAIFYGSGAIVAGGIALKGFSIIVGMASKLVGAFQFALAALRLALSGLMTAASWLPMLANPFVLAGLAVAGLLGYCAYLGGVFSNMGTQWSKFSKETTSSLSAISNAIAKGDLQEAWAVAMAYIRLEWARVVNSVRGIWDGLVTGMAIALFELGWTIRDAFSDVLAWLDKMGDRIVSNIKRAWVEAKRYTHLISGIDAELAQAAITAHELAHQKTVGTDLADEKGERRKYNEDAIAALRSQHNENLDALERELADKKKKLAAAQAAANVPGAGLPENPHGAGAMAAMQAAEVHGTFSGAVASMLGGGQSLAQQQLDAQNETNSYLGRMEQYAKEDLGLSQEDAQGFAEWKLAACVQ